MTVSRCEDRALSPGNDDNFSQKVAASLGESLIIPDEDGSPPLVGPDRVMQTFHYGLNPGGYLFLGPSENVSREIKLFTIIDKKHRILQRHDGVRATLPMVQTASSSRAVEPTRSPVIRGEDRIDQGARRVMDKYAPAYFVIDRHYEVLRFSGAETGRYLEPSPGTATLNLIRHSGKGAAFAGSKCGGDLLRDA
jgi:hypothetical protein